jgi:GMP synthase (glutamine-hydrolysing)
MNIHYLQHVPFEGPGNIMDWVRRGRHTLGATRFYCGDPLPAVETLDLLVVMGGPMNIYEEANYPWLVDEKRFIEQAIAAGRRVLGVCLGAQLVADVLGAKVYANTDKEIGWFPVETTEAASGNGLFAAFPRRIEVFHWHGDTFDIPAGGVHVARSTGCANQAFVYDERVVGLQFHLETTPASALQIIAHSANEIVEGRNIQTPQAMLTDARGFDAINRAMQELLDRLAATPGWTTPAGGVQRETHLPGGVREVTDSCHLFEREPVRFLMDCGMEQGGRDALLRNRKPFDEDPPDNGRGKS